MKNIRRGLCSLLTVIMLFGAAFPAKAIGNDDIKNLAAGLVAMAVNDTNSTFMPGSYSLGDKIPAYRLENEELSVFTEAVYFPVFCNNEPVGIFTVNGANTANPTYSFGEDFIVNLKAAAADNANISFVVTENQIFAVNDTEAVEIVKYDMSPLEVEARAAKSSRSVVSPTELEILDVEEVNLTYEADEYNASEVMNALSNQSINTVEMAAVDKLVMPRTARAFKHVPSPIPQGTQASGSNYCWAYAAWCVGEIKTRYGYSVDRAISYAGGQFGKGGSANMQKSILSGLYGQSSPTLYNQFSQTNIKTLINRGDPFIMLCFVNKNTSALGHSVTCYGYDDANSPIKIAVMDSLVSSGQSNLRWMTSPSSGSDYKITSGSSTYTYVYSLTPRTY